MKKSRVAIYLLTLCVSCTSIHSNEALGQPNQKIQKQSQLILGTWISGTWTLSFDKTSVVKEWFEGKPSDSYQYKITGAKSPCGVQASVDPMDSTSFFLQMDNLTNKKRSCLLINELTAKTLDMEFVGLSRSTVFTRKKEKK